MNKKEILKKVAVTGACIIILTVADVYAADEVTRNLDKLDQFGFRILKMVQRIGYWIVLVKGTTDLVKRMMEGDLHGCAKTMFAYTASFGMLYFFPTLLKMVQGVF